MKERNFDVIVIGGGTTGCCAAIAAARGGCRVLLIEKLPFPGGNMTGGLPWLGFHEKAGHRQVIGGLPMEIIQRLRSCGGATDFVFDPVCGSAVGVNGTMLKMVLERMLLEENVSMLFHSTVIGCAEDAGGCTVTAAEKGKVEEFTAKFVIDCTDSADAAKYMGAGLITGREGDHQRQVSSYVVNFNRIDFAEMLDYFKKRPDQIRPFKLSPEVLDGLVKQMETAPLWVLGAFEEIIAGAQRDGLPYSRKQLIGVAQPAFDQLMLVSSRVENADLSDAGEHTAAEIDGLQQTWVILDLLRGYIPGCRNAQIVSAGAQLGIRESNHCIGEYMLTAEDLLKPAAFDDAVCCGAYHIDIHSPDHNGLETKQPPVYRIPYRSLLPKNTSRLLVAGRCISATHEAMASTRVAPISAAQGEAAGTAAGLAVRKGTGLREIDAAELKELLRRDHVILC